VILVGGTLISTHLVLGVLTLDELSAIRIPQRHRFIDGIATGKRWSVHAICSRLRSDELRRRTLDAADELVTRLPLQWLNVTGALLSSGTFAPC